MSLPVTTWLASGLAVLFVVLTARVIQQRFRARVSLGDGDDPVLLRAIRAHANLIETAPLFVLLVLVAELQGAAGWPIVFPAVVFVLGRVMHGVCLGFLASSMPLRSGGMLLTLLAIIAMIAVDLGIVLG